MTRFNMTRRYKNNFQQGKSQFNNEARSQTKKYETPGFVQIKHKTIEARVNHCETGVSKFEASVILVPINMQHKVIMLF